NTSISPENIAGQSLSVGFRPLPQTTPRRRAAKFPAKYVVMQRSRPIPGGIMKLLNVIEAVLNCLHLAAELWEWLEKHLPVFGAFTLFLG
ncbi:hypothetical protein, partial [Streptomyces rubiginosohelvolus]